MGSETQVSVENLDEVDEQEAAQLAAEEAAMAAEDAQHAAAAPPGEEVEQTVATDAATTGAATEGETTATAEADPAAATTTTETPAEPAPKVVAGVASKDGKTVLPYAALQGARKEASQYRQRAARAEQELADLKAGKKPAEGAELTDEYLQEVAADFPQLAPLVKAVQRSAQAAPAAKPDQSDDNEAADDPVQSAIDTVPLLAAWQAEDPEKWERAKALDRALDGSRPWKGKPLEERFAHVTQLVAKEFDIQVEATAPAPPAPPPTPAKKTPDAVIAGAKRNAPNTLSDFKGGAPDATRENIERMPAPQQMQRFENMSDDAIEAYLRKVG